MENYRNNDIKCKILKLSWEIVSGYSHFLLTLFIVFILFYFLLYSESKGQLFKRSLAGV